MNDFMKGRNGADELTIVMGFAGIKHIVHGGRKKNGES